MRTREVSLQASASERRDRRRTARRRAVGSPNDLRNLASGAIVVGWAALLVGSGPAGAATFLDEVDRGRAAVLGSAPAELASAQGRTSAVDAAIASDDSPAFALGAALAALGLDLDQGKTPPRVARGEREAVERQVRVVLRAQAASGIGNRAVCLLSGRSDPRSIEALIRLVESSWSCGPRHEHD